MRCLMNKMEALQVRRIPPGVWAVPGWGCPQSGYFGAAELHVCYRILLELHQVPSPQAPGALGCPLQQRGGWRFASGPPTKLAFHLRLPEASSQRHCDDINPAT